MKHSSWIQRPTRPEEIKKLSFDCCAEADETLAESVTYGAISPGEGENIEDKIQECVLQLEKVSTTYWYFMNQELTFSFFIYARDLSETEKTWNNLNCFVCFQGECDPEIIAAKLDLYSSCCPHASQIANYWLCRARIAQQEKDFDRVVCLLEQAFVFKAQVFQQLFSHPIHLQALLTWYTNVVK